MTNRFDVSYVPEYLTDDENTHKLSESAVERLVMPDFASVEWGKIARTPAGGTAYYNEALDQVAIKYRHKTKLYYNRIVGTAEKWAACFLECKVFDA